VRVADEVNVFHLLICFLEDIRILETYFPSGVFAAELCLQFENTRLHGLAMVFGVWGLWCLRRTGCGFVRI
jgi:hypothetical protein